MTIQSHHFHTHDKFTQAGQILEGVATLKQQLGAALDENEKLKQRIAELEEATRWRKCSEVLPEDGQEVWAFDSYQNIVIKLEYTSNDDNEGFVGYPIVHGSWPGITHWMPYRRPKAPEGK